MLLAAATYFFLWLFWIVLFCVRFEKSYLWTSTIGGVIILSSARPLFFEYTAELAYPVPEGLIGGVLNAGFNLVSTCNIIESFPNKICDIFLCPFSCIYLDIFY